MRKITFLLALLCVSVMSWATQYCGTALTGDNTGDRAGDALNDQLTFTASKVSANQTLFELTSGKRTLTGLFNGQAVLQNNGGGTVDGDFATGWTVVNNTLQKTVTWTAYPSSNIQVYLVANCDGAPDITGAQIFNIDVSSACSSKPSPELTLNATSKTLEIDASAETFQIVPTKAEGSGAISYSSNATDVATVSETGLVTAVGNGTATITVSVAENASYAAESKTLTVEVIDWPNIGWLTNSNDSYKLHISPTMGGDGQRIEGSNLWIGFPSAAFGDMSIEQSGGDGAWKTFALTNFPGRRSQFTVVCQGTTYTFTVYRKFEGVNLAKNMPSYAGATALPKAEANDGNKGSRWASGGGANHYPAVGDVAQDWWYVDLGAMYEISSIKTLFEGAAPKNYDFLTSPNGDSWVVIDSYNATPNIGNGDENYNEYSYSPGKVGRYVKIFAREAVQGDFAYGISMWEFEVYGQPAESYDTNDPVLSSAALSGDPTSSQVQIAVSATDAEGAVTTYRVKDTSHGIDRNCAVAAGVITISGLAEGTNYSFTITALDAIGNQSNAIVVAASTAADLTIPQVAAPIPDGTGKDVLAIYSDAFPNILAHSFDKDGYAGMTVYAEKNIDGNSCLIYDRSGSAPTYTTWGMYDDGANAIIAAAGYSDPANEGHKGVYASEMEYLHIDIWSLQACSTILIRINDGQRTGSLRLSHSGEGWQSYDIPLSEFEAGANTNNVRWFKFEAFDSVTGKIALDNVYFWKAATGLHAVSATANNASFGTASVVITETGLAPEGGMVTDGTEVTFSATPNDGYIFVDWSNGNTNATFNATVDAAMNLTANFRAQGTVYCNTEVTSTRDDDVHVAYATMKRTSANNYKLVVRSAETLGNFSNTTLQVNGSENLNLNNQGTLTDNNHVLTYEFTSTTPPSMTSGYMYLNVPGSKFTECWFTRLTNIEYEIPCNDDNVPVESISLNYDEATIEIGATKTLVVSFNPVYATDKSITWTSSNGTVASVDGGVVTANTVGTATITAETSNGKTATCAVTVEPITEKTWWGTQTIAWEPAVDVLWSITRNANKTLTYTVYFGDDASGKVKQLNDGVGGTDGWHDLSGYTDENRVASYTTTATYEKGAQLSPKPFFYFGGPRIDLPTSYRVADTNDKPATSVSSVSLNHTSASLEPTEQLQLIVTILPSFVENKAVTWESSNSTIASVTDAGLVTANAVGTATITATSSADGTKTATCTITVVGDLSPETWYGYGKFDVHGKWVAFSYSITRTAERNLYYQTHLSADIAGIAMKINYNDNWYTMSQDESKRNATYTEEGPFVDGNAHNFYFRAEFENGADNNNVTYTIGSSNDALGQAIAIDESADNTSIITAYDEQSVVGIVKRSFTAGNLYTLVLPFDVDAAQTASQLPGQLTKLNNTYVKDNGDLRINFVDASAIEAGVPYLYKPSAAVANPTFEGVEVTAALNPTVADSHAEYHGIYAPMDGDALHAKTNAYVLGPDQYLYAVSDLPDNQTMAALRAYFVLNFPPAGPGAPKRLAKVVFNENETETTTDYENLQTDNTCIKVIVNGQLQIIRDGKTYNAFGQLVK